MHPTKQTQIWQRTPECWKSRIEKPEWETIMRYSLQNFMLFSLSYEKTKTVYRDSCLCPWQSLTWKTLNPLLDFALLSLSKGAIAQNEPWPPSRVSSILPGLGWLLSNFYTLALLHDLFSLGLLDQSSVSPVLLQFRSYICRFGQVEF
jgi:hypothetical protein